jgi:hypothetical protein
VSQKVIKTFKTMTAPTVALKSPFVPLFLRRSYEDENRREKNISGSPFENFPFLVPLFDKEGLGEIS